MRVSNVVTARVKGGQVEAAVAAAIDAAGLVGRHGGDVHFYLAGVAGEEVNSTVFSVEYESPEALGAAFDAMSQDAEIQAFTMRLNGPDSPSEIRSTSMIMELPLGRDPKPGEGGILEVHLGKPNPGRMEEVLAEAAAVCDFVEANGAANARLQQLTYAGMASGMTAFTWELENMAAHASLGEAWFSDADLALQAEQAGTNPASITRSSGLYNRIPL